MGRVTRGVVRALAHDPAFDVTLLAAGRDARALAAEFTDARIAPSRAARHGRAFDVVWYPFNAMRFAAAAPCLVSIYDAFAFTERHSELVARIREQRPIARAARRAARIVTASAWSRSEIARELRLPPAAIAVIRPAPDAFFFPASGDAALPSTLASATFALVVGASEARKNVRLAIDACALAFAGADETLAIVGTLPPAERARVLELRLRCGEIAPGDEVLRALYRNAAVVLVPSRAEGFGLVAVEALACGAAVIAADTAALPEATQGAALLLPPDEPRLWSDAIRGLFDDPVRRAHARAQAAALFAYADRTAHVRAMAALLRETAGAGP